MRAETIAKESWRCELLDASGHVVFWSSSFKSRQIALAFAADAVSKFFLGTEVRLQVRSSGESRFKVVP